MINVHDDYFLPIHFNFEIEILSEEDTFKFKGVQKLICKFYLKAI